MKPRLRHAIGYLGRFERNFAKLKPDLHRYERADGSFRDVAGRPRNADGVFFGYMERTGKRFVAVRAQSEGADVVVANPVPLRPSRHTDGKGFGPTPSRFGDDSAERLLNDLIAANPAQAPALKRIAERFGWRASEAGPSGGRQEAIHTAYYAPDMEALEGNPRLETHLKRERNRTLAEAKKSTTLQETGRLRCEVCTFDFTKAYRGLAPFCEVHHRRPLGDRPVPTKTTLRSLAVLCANCHRAIHLTRPLMSVEKFKLRVWRGA